MKYLALLFLLIPTLIFAQDNENKREKIKQLKIAFITTELKLSSDESVKFWPLYNAAEDEIHEIKRVKYNAFSKYIKNKKEADILEADAKKFVEIAEDCERKILDIKSRLSQDLGNSISFKKIVYLKKAEEDFKQKLLEQYKKNKS